MTRFWTNSTTAQKLVQINGAIECGMTATQCAMNLRVTKHTVLGFMRNRGGYPLTPDHKRNGEVAQHVRKRRTREQFGHQPLIEPIYRRDNTDKLFEDHPHDH